MYSIPRRQHGPCLCKWVKLDPKKRVGLYLVSCHITNIRSTDDELLIFRSFQVTPSRAQMLDVLLSHLNTRFEEIFLTPVQRTSWLIPQRNSLQYIYFFNTLQKRRRQASTYCTCWYILCIYRREMCKSCELHAKAEEILSLNLQHEETSCQQLFINRTFREPICQTLACTATG